jgi:hypothetical protein
MDADILLFCLHHPYTLLAHCPYNAKNIHMIRHLDLLQNSVQGNKCTGAANTSTANITSSDSTTNKLHSTGHIFNYQMKVHLLSSTGLNCFFVKI